MKRPILALGIVLLTISCGKQEVLVTAPEGTLRIRALADDAIRVRLVPEGAPVLDELIFPVTEGGVTQWRVYLPENEGGWEDIRSGAHMEGGRYHDVPVDMEDIPVFKREQ